MTIDLIQAVTGHDLDVISLLCKKGETINLISAVNKYRLGHIFERAVIERHKDLLQFILTKKYLDINSPDYNYRKIPLHMAAEFGDKDTVQFLIENGSDINTIDKDGDTCLHYAASNGNTGVIPFLIYEKGLKIDTTNNNGETCLHLAAQEGHKDTVQLLIENSANVNAANNDGDTCLHYAANYALFTDDLERLLVKNGAVIDVVNSSGITCLHMAIQKYKIPTCKFLIDNGADINAADKEEATCLQ